MKPHEPFKLKKTIWDENDFENMGWHDVHIHSIAFQPEVYELHFDIDYMFAWVDPEPPDTHYSFWIAPCTWAFENVYNFKANIDWGLGLEISSVSREFIGKPKNANHIQRDKEWKWILDCQEGELSFISVGYKQFVRNEPIRFSSQKFDWAERNGISFNKSTFQ